MTAWRWGPAEDQDGAVALAVDLLGLEDRPRRLPDCSRLRHLLGWAPAYGLDDTIDAVAGHLAGRGGASALGGLG